jgi:hypothetical protein
MIQWRGTDRAATSSAAHPQLVVWLAMVTTGVLALFEQFAALPAAVAACVSGYIISSAARHDR